MPVPVGLQGEVQRDGKQICLVSGGENPGELGKNSLIGTVHGLHINRLKPNSILIMCDYCEETFSRQWNLKVHMRRKHGIGQSLSCQTCGAKFRSLVQLNHHTENQLCQPSTTDAPHIDWNFLS